ncbi:DUF3052 family protein [Archangium sp.]|uniref:DUF3052 family protein n=1 Tax=Archangium sp. TaxID=1872627 RepID=UPI00286AEF34|nr:DUF3052 family protein [Archangium sp.]HLM48212.1 DUF3052 family protein [Myxococcaceae bacterium]
MTPYAMASLPAMLGIKSGSKVSVINPPRGFVQQLNPLPDGVEFLITAQTGLDVILFFTQDAHELVQRLPALSRAMALTGGIWVCWPSGEGIKTALSEDFIRQAALDIGLVDNKLCLIDSTWTGLRLVRRPRGRLDKPDHRKKLPTAQA